MVNRRFLRIKAMQALYSFFQSEKNDLGKTEKELLLNIEKIYDLYIYIFSLLLEMHHSAKLQMEDARHKMLPSQEDLNPNKKLIENSVLAALADNQQLNKEITNRKISWQNDLDLVRKVLNDVRQSEEYKSYMTSGKSDVSEDKDFIASVMANIIAEHELLNYWLEEHNIHWADDVYIAFTTVIRSIENADAKGKITLVPLYKDPVEDKLFVRELLTKCVIHNEEYEQMISEKTKNWEVERIALMDVLLMKMALTEIMCFESIPVKVSLNEYIELSKQYSTPKSKMFINGILDKIVLDLKKENRISKTGRGLLET
ncbi:MAG: transcription antitermination factor NusB [Bacteroidia bacterium]